MEFIGPQPDELEKVHNGAYIAGMLPYFKAEIAQLVQAEQRKVFAAIRDNTFTKEMAADAWRTLYCYQKIIKRFDVMVKLGQHSGEKVADEMTIGD